MEDMNILWIFAHPERASLNGSLMDAAVAELDASGHHTEVHDLYRMGFAPLLDAADLGVPPGERLVVGQSQQRALESGALGADIRAEQDALLRADVVVLHFPLWWFGPPAILKGWFDRVLGQGFAFGLKDEAGRTRRYGDGGLAGLRGLVVTSVGARESGFSARGIHGDIEQVLWPIQHGTFFYTGIAALRPHVVYGADRAGSEDFACAAKGLRARMRTLHSEDPIDYRRESGPDYDADLRLHPGLAPGRTDLDIHRAS